jgi:polyisoprenyl-phosphate glycosyltransferase
MSLVSIVVPVFQNEGSLLDVLAQLRMLAEKNPTNQFEFVFVDDGSHDESWRVLQDLARNEPRVRAIKLSRNFGANAALLAGLR